VLQVRLPAAENTVVQMTLRERLLPGLAAGVAIAALPGAIELAYGQTPVAIAGTIHFYAVGMTALAAAGASVALTVIGARFDDTRTVLIGTAFAVMAALLALHGIATPGVIFSKYQYGAVMLTGGATLPAGAAILALSAFTLPRFLRGVKPLLILQAALLAVVFAIGAVALFFPSVLPEVPAARSTPAYIVLAAGLLLFAVLAARALRTFLLTRRLPDLLVIIGIVWLATALVAALTLSATELGWWLGHMFELDGILIIGIPVALDLAHTVQSRPLAGDLHAADLVSSEEVFLGSHVRALTLRLARKDGYTEQHTRRVALRAVQVGEALGLSKIKLRRLAIGGLVHDIGKLSVPDSILKKPGPLDDAEYALIKRHAESGARLLEEVGGFSDAVRRLVRDHHERLDGLGYPRGLTADAIGLDTRILTVCDVYDALISPRVYRPAWSHEQAIALLHAEAGTAFDTRCITALEDVLARETAGMPASHRRSFRPNVAVPATVET
jgi:HD-GYP domain-containing protein (c-di-GMP phosphodiesterase class II)